MATLESFHDLPWLQPYPDRLLDEEIVARETIELTFLAVIQLLPPRQRAVLILRDVLDWPAEQVAEQLELSVAGGQQRAAAGAGDASATACPREEWRARGERRPSASCSTASSTRTSAATPTRRSR